MSRISTLVAAAVLLGLVAGCATEADPPGRSSTRIVSAPEPTPVPSAASPRLGGTAPGSLTAASPVRVPALEALGAHAWRVAYVSTDDQGASVPVTGLVAVPSSAPPRAGWPVLALGHGSTGIDTECGPSSKTNLFGNAGAVASFVDQGFVVAMSDYEGLGVPGRAHRFFDAADLGRNVIDSVRAARKVDASVSDRWLAYGVSLGGMAAWAAHDLAPTYGRGLDQLGSAAAVPISDPTGLATEVGSASLARAQFTVLSFFLESSSRTEPGLDLDAYRSARARRLWPLLTTCDVSKAPAVTRAVTSLTPADLSSDDPAAIAELRRRLAAGRLPLATSRAPLLVAYGSLDQLQPRAATRAAIARACRAGTPVESYEVRSQGHRDLSLPTLVPWLQARVDGVPALDRCRSTVLP